MKFRKAVSAAAAALLALCLLAGCGGGDEEAVTEKAVLFRAEIGAEDISGIVQTEDVTLKAGQSVQDAMDEISYDADTVEAVSFSFNSVDFKTPGVYEADCTAIVSASAAEQILHESIDAEDDADVSLTFTFPVTVLD